MILRITCITKMYRAVPPIFWKTMGQRMCLIVMMRLRGFIIWMQGIIIRRMEDFYLRILIGGRQTSRIHSICMFIVQTILWIMWILVDIILWNFQLKCIGLHWVNIKRELIYQMFRILILKRCLKVGWKIV